MNMEILYTRTDICSIPCEIKKHGEKFYERLQGLVDHDQFDHYCQGNLPKCSMSSAIMMQAALNYKVPKIIFISIRSF